MLLLVKCTSAFLRADMHLEGFCMHEILCMKNYNLWRAAKVFLKKEFNFSLYATVTSCNKSLKFDALISDNTGNSSKTQKNISSKKFANPLCYCNLIQKKTEKFSKSFNLSKKLKNLIFGLFFGLELPKKEFFPQKILGQFYDYMLL